MISALLVPSALLAVVLGAGAVLLFAARAGCRRGMGRRPMLDLSRATYPTARSTASQARQLSPSSQSMQGQGVPLRWVKLVDDPRGAAPAKAWPFSSLGDNRAGGAPALRCAHGDDGYSGETPSVLEELAPSQPRPASSPVSRSLNDGGASVVCASCDGRCLCFATAYSAACAHVARQPVECGQVPHRASGHPHVQHVGGALVHTFGTGAASASSPFPVLTGHAI